MTSNSRPSQQAIYIWNIVGSAMNALLSMVLLMIVTRLVTGKKADIFSIAWAISQLMATIGTFQIRNYQATDVKELFKFRQYLIFRILTITCMLICSGIYIVAQGYDFHKSIIIFVICVFRAIDALAEIYEGLFQQRERLDLAGKAITFRVVLGTIVFGAVLFFSRNILYATLALVFAYIVGFVLTNLRYCHFILGTTVKCESKMGFEWVVRLAKEGLPLFVNAFLMTAITNEPKMAIDQAIELGEMANGMQTVFNVLFMPASVLTLVYIVFRPMMTQMAIMWMNKKINDFLKILFKVGGCLLGISIVILFGSFILGIPVLSWIYAIDLSGYRIHLLLFVLGGCFCTFSYVLDNALVVIRYQYMLILSYVITWIYVKIITGWLVSTYEMLGAAVAYSSSMVVFFVFTACIFAICFKRGEIKIKQ